LCRSGLSRSFTVFGRQDVVYPAKIDPTPPYIDQRAHHDAHHIMQETVAFDRDLDLVAGDLPDDLSDDA
jgi:spore maturation protein CgeB